MKNNPFYEEMRLADFYQSSEKHLFTTLKQARLNSDHPDAIGGPIEAFVKNLLEDQIPKGCKIHPGHIVCGDNPNTSGTLYDLVIYRPDISGPLSKIDSFFVFPLECVVGAIEITSYLDEKKMKTDIDKLTKLRLMNRRYYWLSTGSVTHAPVYETDIITPRCFMFAAEVKWKKEITFAKHLQKILKDTGKREVHIHAIYAGNCGYFDVRPRGSNLDPFFTIGYEKKNPLLTFINQVAVSVHRFPTMPTRNNLYFEENGKKVSVCSLDLYPRLEKYGMKVKDIEVLLPGIDISSGDNPP